MARQEAEVAVATEQAKFVFYDGNENKQRLELLAERERRTVTSMLREALELLFASRDNENHSRKT